MSCRADWNSRDRKPTGLPNGWRSSVDGAAAVDPSRIAQALERFGSCPVTDALLENGQGHVTVRPF
jgi:hypothetical protein